MLDEREDHAHPPSSLQILVVFMDEELMQLLVQELYLTGIRGFSVSMHEDYRDEWLAE